MKITELPTADLLRYLRATERSKDPDPYALSVLQRELERRLDATIPPGDKRASEGGEVKP